ncbi:unnamed protein product [Amoebophrya sp. A25]|nr:unnamed protein product [Amoebophrya sp. A25]|eukprot:GSA25T00013641001.1
MRCINSEASAILARRGASRNHASRELFRRSILGLDACTSGGAWTPNRRFICSRSASRLEKMLFAKSHEWFRVADDKKSVTIGVSDFAQKELGKIVYVDMPEPGHHVPASDSVAAIECGDGKAVGEVYTPADCDVEEVNEQLTEEPGIINADCYGNGWIVKAKFADEFDGADLMDEAAYLKYLETCESHH